MSRNARSRPAPSFLAALASMLPHSRRPTDQPPPSARHRPLGISQSPGIDCLAPARFPNHPQPSTGSKLHSRTHAPSHLRTCAPRSRPLALVRLRFPALSHNPFTYTCASAPLCALAPACMRSRAPARSRACAPACAPARRRAVTLHRALSPSSRCSCAPARFLT